MSTQLVDFLNKYIYYIWIAAFVAIFYFTLILPQKRRQKKHSKLLESLEVGDKVVTMGGIFGTIKKVFDNKIRITVAPNVDIEIAKNAVSRKLTK